MAATIPSFLTGANAKIKINDVVMAFATDIQYSIAVAHASPRVLGRYEVEEHQPLKYDVRGSFTIIRYTDAPGINAFQPTKTTEELVLPTGNGIAGQVLAPHVVKTTTAVGGPVGGISDANPSGNGIGKWQKEAGGVFGDIFTGAGATGSLDPSKMHRALGFEIEIHQKTGDGTRSIARFRGCRITTTNFRIDKKSVAKQSFEFIAQYGDEDSFITGESGVGQQFS